MLKSTLCILAFASTAVLAVGCIAQPDEEPESSIAGEGDDAADVADESTSEAEQGLDSNCQDRTCVSCGVNKWRPKTVTYQKIYENGTYHCGSLVSTTYGTCSAFCAE